MLKKQLKTKYWIASLIFAAVLRLLALAHTPLNPEEALRALPSWDVSQGAAWPLTAASPLLLTGNALLFTLFGPGDGLARLLPALLGSALVLLPFLWRRQLGEGGALVAAGLLTLSPLALFASRHLTAAGAGALGGALVLTALWQPEMPPKRQRAAIAVGLALGLTGGPVFYDVLLPGLLAWAITRLPAPARATLKTGLIAGLAGAVLISIALGMRWSGWSGPAAGLAAWLTGWRTAGAASANPALLLLYEPLTLLLAGVGALLLFIQKKRRALAGWGVWTLYAILLTALRSGAEPLSLLAVLIPLALLAGKTGEYLQREIPGWRWHAAKIHAPLSLIFWLFAGLALTRQTSNLQNGLEILLLVLIAIIQGLLVAGFQTLTRRAATWQALLVGTAAALLLIQLSFGWGVNFARPANVNEPLVTSAASFDLRNLRRTVEELRIAQQESEETFTVAVLAGAPGSTAALRWALRDVPTLEVVDSWPLILPHLLITPAEYVPPAGAETTALRGAQFTISTHSGGAIPGCINLFPPLCEAPLNWYFYRQSPHPPAQEHFILWETRKSQMTN
ncbi:MAG: hypothetical protein U9Q70_00865 [Chloroflexota bacterium]|nr:hypothetical protein [Chloroflexota bacterium]